MFEWKRLNMIANLVAFMIGLAVMYSLVALDAASAMTRAFCTLNRLAVENAGILALAVVLVSLTTLFLEIGSRHH